MISSVIAFEAVYVIKFVARGRIELPTPCFSDMG